MAIKITAAGVTLLLVLAAAFVVLATMIIAMNGYHESDATWGLGAFVILSLIDMALMSLAAFLGAGALKKRQYGAFAAAILPVLVFAIVGVGLEVVSGGLGIAIAEVVRVNF